MVKNEDLYYHDPIKKNENGELDIPSDTGTNKMMTKIGPYGDRLTIKKRGGNAFTKRRTAYNHAILVETK